jgi:hypothetical protein
MRDLTVIASTVVPPQSAVIVGNTCVVADQGSARANRRLATIAWERAQTRQSRSALKRAAAHR